MEHPTVFHVNDFPVVNGTPGIIQDPIDLLLTRAEGIAPGKARAILRNIQQYDRIPPWFRLCIVSIPPWLCLGILYQFKFSCFCVHLGCPCIT